MRAVIQRVISASVSVEGRVVGSIGKGLLVLVGIDRTDVPSDSTSIIKKILSAKLFDQDDTLWKATVKDIEGEILCVSQFTLLATLQKGSKPDFHQSMSTEPSRVMYNAFLEEIGKAYRPDRIQNGQFGAMMQVSLINDGPTTILLDTKEPKPPSRNASGSSTPTSLSVTPANSQVEEERQRAAARAKVKADKAALYAARAAANFKKREEAAALGFGGEGKGKGGRRRSEGEGKGKVEEGGVEGVAGGDLTDKVSELRMEQIL